ncbi:hypothetical protein GCM10027598_75650 [Amycolatopsis oliviviridis]|uniref:Transmembrane protein n=1 Tax=Amycolatopsis oliviviridis TaxID=1471590 RepID=A0ABQ3L4S8_9PSEU|nr:hypothetical protein [Amycolatopsis oliviviridis]GHH03595.1 hypothetical protein GCM10017790_05590 [Amycolatopsis oliviviridis]
MPGKPRIPRVLLVVPAGISFVVLLVALGGFLGDRVDKLNTGEEVTVVEISECFDERPPVTGRGTYCEGGWRFDDGRTAQGRIEGEKAAVGDRVFAGDGFAYRSKTMVILSLSVTVAIGLALLGMPIGLGLQYRKYRKYEARRRREE